MSAERPDWHTYFLRVAEAVSLRGDCRRSKVGAVIVDANRIVVSTGFNGVVPGAVGCLAGACPRGRQSYSARPSDGNYDDCIAYHAEHNAVIFARRANQAQRMLGSTIYTTREPCPDCQNILFNHGVRQAWWPSGKVWLK